jgi:hypothetical protein
MLRNEQRNVIPERAGILPPEKKFAETQFPQPFTR